MTSGPTLLRFLSDKNPIQRVAEPVREKLKRAQENHFEFQFASAAALLARSADDLKLKIHIPRELSSAPASSLADKPYSSLLDDILPIIKAAGVAPDAARLHALAVSQRIHLLRAFDDPDRVLSRASLKIAAIVETFPKTAADIECGRNPGDV